jgi:N-acetylneuraminate synthase
MTQIRIGDRWLGDGQPCYIVAEAGSNHNGRLDQAFKLIDVAVAAGVDAIKFQHFKADRLYPKSAGQSAYLGTTRPIFDIIREMETPDEWVPHLAEYCHERGITFLSTPFDEASADLLEPFVPAYKIASYEMTHTPLVRHVARKGKPMIISTGAATMDEVLRLVGDVTAQGNRQIVLMQCTAHYPTALEHVNARAMATLRECTGLLTGLSDHSRDPIVAPMTAAAMGASVIEKHFTLGNHLPGPDHAFAVEPSELAELVRRVRQVEQVRGDGRKEILAPETELHGFARRSIFAVRDIEASESLTPVNIAVLRCGNKGFGLAPELFPDLLDRTAARRITKESLITRADVV